MIRGNAVRAGEVAPFGGPGKLPPARRGP